MAVCLFLAPTGYGLLLFLLCILGFAIQVVGEESVLRRELSGYEA